jgi:hypothetical protein
MKNVELMEMTIKEVEKKLSEYFIHKSNEFSEIMSVPFIFIAIVAVINSIVESMEGDTIKEDLSISPVEFEVIYCLTALKLIEDQKLIYKIEEQSKKKFNFDLKYFDTDCPNFEMFFLSLLRSTIVKLKDITIPTDISEIVNKYTHYENNFYIYLSKLKGARIYLKELIKSLSDESESESFENEFPEEMPDIFRHNQEKKEIH